jgi:hypothetical protein
VKHNKDLVSAVRGICGNIDKLSTKTFGKFGNALDMQNHTESKTHPVAINKMIAKHIKSSNKLTTLIEDFADFVVDMDLADVEEWETALDIILADGKDAMDVSRTIVEAVLNIPNTFMTFGEFGGRIASKLTSHTSMELFQDPETNSCLRSYAHRLVSLAAECKLITLEKFGGNERADGSISDTFIKITPLITLPSKLSRWVDIAGDSMLPSLVPNRTMDKEGNSPYRSGIPFQLFNATHLRGLSFEAPLYVVNICNQMPLYVDHDLLSEYKTLPIPYNVTDWYAQSSKMDSNAITHSYMKHLGSNPCYITHCLDSKHRVYDKSRYIKKQGNDSFKSLVDSGEYTITKASDFTIALKACKIQIANCLDLDKLSMPDRIMLVDGLIASKELLSVSKRLKKQAKKDKDGKAPIMQLRKAIRELDKLLGCVGHTDIKREKKRAKLITKGKLSIKLRGMVALDATCSFAQICALLSGQTTDAWNSNLLDVKGETNRIDLYMALFNKMMGYKKFKPAIKTVTRGHAKDGILQTTYGSSTAWEVFAGNTAKRSEYNKEVFKKCMTDVMPGTVEVLEHIRSMLDDNAEGYAWTLPDGCESACHHTTVNTDNPTKLAKRLCSEVPVYIDDELVSVEQVFTNRAINGGENIGLMALVIQSVDAFIARTLVTECHEAGFDVHSIHDSFSCRYVHMEQMKAIYKDIIVRLADTDLMEEITEEITDGEMTYKKSPMLAKALSKRQGDHSIC